MRKLITLASAAALLLSLAGPASAVRSPASDHAAANAPKADSLSSPLADKQAAEKDVAIQKVMAGTAKTTGKNQVVKLAPGQYVELARQGEDNIWTTLGEFGDTIHPVLGGDAGPVHNEIPQPDRQFDNSTIWQPDFSQAYYQHLLFSDAPGDVSMTNFYEEQSSNRYSVDGSVEDWVQVPGNEAYYGADYCGDIVCARTWLFVNDSIDAWYNARVADGWTDDQINAYLAQFDQWDRYDYDGDGNFNEPDGYIDHYQAIHAGEGEETGGGAQGTDAIWSHRWYDQLTPIGSGGPTVNGEVVPFGGSRIGNSNFWVGDYTVEPENGGVGVFSHEYGHDLGLPDLYDTSGNTGGAENSTGFWTLYSSGSYGNSGKPEDGLGTQPISMSIYEKIFLGWDDYTVIGYGQKASVKLGPAVATTKQAQGLVLLLPDKHVTFDVGAPFAGDWMYYSGAGNAFDHSMTKSVTLPAGSPTLTAKVKYSAENNFDYGFVTVNGAPVDTNRSSHTDPNGNNPSGFGITGSSGGAWVDLTADLTAFAGQTVTIGFEYATDPAVAESGFFYDEIAIPGQAVDGAETDTGWTMDGYSRTQQFVDRSFFNAYFAEYRTYLGYDDGLRTGPYNFSFGNDPDYFNWVQHFPYQDGLLVWYYDTSFADNNVGDNCLGPDKVAGSADDRCGGLYLPVDAHPNLLIRPDNGQVWRPRVQSFDSTFGLQKTDKVCLYQNSAGPSCIGGLPANPKFDDNQSYWVNPATTPGIGNNGWSSVIVPHTGTTIRVVSVSDHGGFMQVLVNK